MLFASSRGDDVPESDFVTGLILGAVGIGLLPAAAYYALGRALGHRRGILAVVWAVSQVPLYLYLVLTSLYIADLTYCGPDAYECPL